MIYYINGNGLIFCISCYPKLSGTWLITVNNRLKARLAWSIYVYWLAYLGLFFSFNDFNKIIVKNMNGVISMISDDGCWQIVQLKGVRLMGNTILCFLRANILKTTHCATQLLNTMLYLNKNIASWNIIKDHWLIDRWGTSFKIKSYFVAKGLFLRQFWR